MKIIEIKQSGFTQGRFQIGHDYTGRPVYGFANKNNYILTIEEDTPLGYVAKNEIDVPTELIDELNAFMEQFSAKCEREFERMKIGILY